MITTSTRRIDFIETLRALAACAVMLFHFTSYFNGNEYIIADEGVRTFSQYGALGVQLFYIISGFVITYALRQSNYRISDYFRYMAKRILRIHPTYIAVISTMLLVTYIQVRFLWHGDFWINKKEVLTNVTFTVDLFSHYNVSWMNPIFKTLAVEFQFYLLIGILFPLIDANKLLRFTGLMIWLGATPYFIGYESVMNNAPYFVLGYFLMDLYQDAKDYYAKTGILMTLLLFAFYFPMQNFVLACTAVLLIHFLRPSFGFSNRIGNASYSLYLVHGVFGGTFLFYTTREGWLANYPVVCIALACLISIGGAFAYYYAFERPSMRWGKKISYQGRNK